MKAYVILYYDAWLNTHKVLQQAYKTLVEAQEFCKDRLGMNTYPSNPAICGDRVYTFGNGATKQYYVIVEVSI